MPFWRLVFKRVFFFGDKLIKLYILSKSRNILLMIATVFVDFNPDDGVPNPANGIFNPASGVRNPVGGVVQPRSWRPERH